MEAEKLKYEILVRAFDNGRVPYALLLNTEEWMYRREEIIKRDSKVCKKCGRGPTIDQVSKNEYFGFEWVERRVSNANYPKVDIEEMYWSDKPYNLEVHHKFYVLGSLPWDYSDDALVTLCNWCHQEIHNTTVIPVLNHEGEALGYTPCNRCNGSGSLPEYSHVQSGVCFKCNGARYEELTDK
jgi:hypothetical protein